MQLGGGEEADEEQAWTGTLPQLGEAEDEDVCIWLDTLPHLWVPLDTQGWLVPLEQLGEAEAEVQGWLEPLPQQGEAEVDG